MAITVKKSSSPKTLRVAPRSTPESTGQDAEAEAAAAEAVFNAGRKRSYTVDIVLGIIGCLVFGALIAVQAIEWTFYEQPPQRAFPLLQTEDTLSLGQQWGAAPMGIQVALVIYTLMLVLGIVAITTSIIKSVKSRSEAIA